MGEHRFMNESDMIAMIRHQMPPRQEQPDNVLPWCRFFDERAVTLEFTRSGHVVHAAHRLEAIKLMALEMPTAILDVHEGLGLSRPDAVECPEQLRLLFRVVAREALDTFYTRPLYDGTRMYRRHTILFCQDPAHAIEVVISRQCSRPACRAGGRCRVSEVPGLRPLGDGEWRCEAPFTLDARPRLVLIAEGRIWTAPPDEAGAIERQVKLLIHEGYTYEHEGMMPIPERIAARAQTAAVEMVERALRTGTLADPISVTVGDICSCHPERDVVLALWVDTDASAEPPMRGAPWRIRFPEVDDGD